jgi:hypothetical protein
VKGSTFRGIKKEQGSVLCQSGFVLAVVLPETEPVCAISGEHDKEGPMLGGLDGLADLVGARPLAGAVIGRDGKVVCFAHRQTIHGR